MDDSTSTPKRGRGRPRKNQLTTESEAVFSNSKDINDTIDETRFDFIDSESQSTPEIANFNPLSESTVERDYSKPPIQEGYVPDLEEPQFHQPTFNDIRRDRGEQVFDNANNNSEPQFQQGATAASDPFSNPTMNELDDREKRLASEHMVDAVLDTYETLSTMSGNLAKMDEQKIRDLIADGKISPNRRIPVDEHGNTVSVMEFIQGYNEQVGGAVENDPAFRKKVRPVMVRVFSKRGWGMTDEQFLLFAFGKDISVKAVTLYGMKKGVNDILKRLQEEAKPQRKTRPTPQVVEKEEEQYIEPETEELTDDDIAYMERMEQIMAEQERLRNEIEKSEREKESNKDNQQKDGVNKMKIVFDENPLREKVVREYPAPKVEETYIQGGEIIDDIQVSDKTEDNYPLADESENKSED